MLRERWWMTVETLDVAHELLEICLDAFERFSPTEDRPRRTVRASRYRKSAMVRTFALISRLLFAERDPMDLPIRRESMALI